MSCNKKCKDHLEKEFKSKKEMAKHWGLNVCTVSNRLKDGWGLEKALTTPPGQFINNIKCKDHLENEYESIIEMAKQWKINASTLNQRLNNGWGLEKALTTPTRSFNLIEDPVTKEYYNTAQLGKKYNIIREVLKDRLKNYTVIQSIGISIMVKRNIVNINKTKYNLTVVKRIKPGKDVFECYIDNGDGNSIFRIMSYDMIDQYCLEQYKKLHNIE